MKKKLLAILTATLLVVTLIPMFAFPAFADSDPWKGKGTETEPYLIGTLAELEALAENVNGGIDYDGKYFKLTADIDGLTTPIGYKDNWDDIKKPFSGVFDGAGHIVSLKIDTSDNEHYSAGMFGYISNATIKNVNVTGEVIGADNAGGICGFNNKSNISNCSNSARISGGPGVGGIAGNNSSGGSGYKIVNCYNTGEVSGSGNCVGGIAGCSDLLNLNNCYNTGNVSGLYYVGGISGYCSNRLIIANCYSVGTVTGEGYVNAIVGILYVDRGISPKCDNCYYDSTIYIAVDTTTGVTGLTTTQMQAESGEDKALIDSLNGYKPQDTDYEYPEFFAKWTKKAGAHYPVFDVPYDVIIADSENGKVTSDASTYKAGTEVTLKVAADNGYKLASLKAIDADGDEVVIKDNKFTMPPVDVVVTATFEKDVPKTGDENNMILWIVLAFVAAGLAVGTVLKAKKANE